MKRPKAFRSADLIETPEGHKKANAIAGEQGANDEGRERNRQILGNNDEIRDVKGIHELTPDELKIVIQNASLGIGYNLSSDNPQPQGKQVIAMSLDDHLHIDARNVSHVETLITYTSRASSYARSGWAKVAASVSTPWVAASVEASYAASAASTSSSKTVYMTGKYNFSQCTITLPAIFKLKPHPDFQQEIDNALARPKDQRTDELDAVFQRWGHVYVSSVELGGMKITEKKETDVSTTNESSKEAELKASISAKFGLFGSGSISGGAGRSTTEGEDTTQRQENLSFNTIGGNTVTQDITEWRKSLTSPSSWTVIGVLQVESTIDLFDAETQARIAAAQPKFRGTVYQLDSILAYSSHRDADYYYTSVTFPLLDFPLHKTFSITAWYFIDKHIDGDYRDSDHTILTCSDPYHTILTLSSTPEKVKVVIRDTEQLCWLACDALINEWVHIAIVQNVEEGRLHFYVHGRERQNKVFGKNYLYTLGKPTDLRLSLGPHTAPVQTAWGTDGQISGVCVFDTALDVRVIETMQKTTMPGTTGTSPFVYSGPVYK